MLDCLGGKRIGVALCGSFCTFKYVFGAISALQEAGALIFPVMSFNAASIDTRFGKAQDHLQYLEKVTGNGVIRTIEAAEPIGPKKMFDLLVVANCTGNTLAKLAASITDTPVTMAVKSHLRAQRPVLISLATNDALAGTAKNLGAVMNYRHYYFVPLRQDDSVNKPTSLVADFLRLPEAAAGALSGIQVQPVF